MVNRSLCCTSVLVVLFACSSAFSADKLNHCIETLKSQEWDALSATAVVEFNAQYFELLQERNADELDRTMKVLGRLGSRPTAQATLAEQPELAGLLASSLESDKNGPMWISKSLRRAEDRPILMTLYGLCSDSAECVSLAQMLDRDGDIISRLCRNDAWDAVVWFERLPTDREAQRQYRMWLRDLLDAAMRSDDEQSLDRAQTLLTIHSANIREKLDGDLTFRDEFVDQLWPMFAKILNDQTDDVAWGIYVCDPRVWDLLSRYGKRGQQLFASHGPIAVDLLVGTEYRDCYDRVLDALESSDERTIDALYDDELRQEPLFGKLLNRKLPGGTMAKALHNLALDRINAPSLLTNYDKLSNAALIEQLGPPPDGPTTWIPGYSIYYLAKKYAQGRDISGMDVVMAAVDVAEIVPLVKGTSKGVKLVQQGVKRSLQKRGMTRLAKRAEKQSARELFPWTLRHNHGLVRESHLALKGIAVADVTRLVRFTFQKSGFGRTTFKRLSSLEARVFMRSDRRVVILIDPNRIASRVGKVVVEHLASTATEAGVSIAIDTISPANNQGNEVRPIGKTWNREQTRAWNRHISTWWLANAIGTFDQVESPASNN